MTPIASIATNPDARTALSRAGRINSLLFIEALPFWFAFSLPGCAGRRLESVPETGLAPSRGPKERFDPVNPPKRTSGIERAIGRRPPAVERFTESGSAAAAFPGNEGGATHTGCSRPHRR